MGCWPSITLSIHISGGWWVAGRRDQACVGVDSPQPGALGNSHCLGTGSSTQTLLLSRVPCLGAPTPSPVGTCV